MATVYSLIVWGGKDGYTVTLSNASPCVMTTTVPTNHGLRDGTAIVLSTTSTLPTGLTPGTPYYFKSTGAKTGNLYTDAAMTTIVNTSSAGLGTHTAKAHYYTSLASKTRWTYDSVEYIFSGLAAWNTHRTTTVPALPYDTEICEIGMDFDDWSYDASGFTITVASQTVRIETKVDGVRSDGFHGGDATDGYQFKLDSAYSPYAIIIGGYRRTIDGIRCSVTNTGSGIKLNGRARSINNIVTGTTSSGSYGIACASSGTEALFNLVKGFAKGINTAYAINGHVIANNFITSCTTGMAAEVSGISGFMYNNISVGNTTNWDTLTSGPEGADKNAGLSGEAWKTGSGTRITVDTTTDFVNFAGGNYRPATSSSPQVDTGVNYYELLGYDIAGDEVPNYNNGGAEAADVGCYEFDHEYGLHPNVVDIVGSGIVDGTRIKIAKQSDGTEYRNVVLSGATTDSFTQNVTSDLDVYIYARKSSGSVWYHPVKLQATILADGGLTYDLTGLQVEDIAAATYDAQIDTDWTFNFSTGAIAHASGTTRWSVQGVYSAHQNAADTSTAIDDAPLMHGTTPTQFELINSGTITDADLEDLYGGSIEFQDGTIWASFYTVGSLAGSPTLYLYEGSTLVTAFWSAGHIDILTKVVNAGSVIASGIKTVFARKWGYTFDHWTTTDMSAGGRHVAALSTVADPANTTARATVAAYALAAPTFSTYSRDFGDGDGPQTYYCEWDCAGLSLAENYEYSKYLTDESQTATLNGVPGKRYLSAHSSIDANKTAPFGTYSGGIWQVAKGVWLKNVPSADTYNYIVTDAAGGTHQNVQTPGALAATVLDGSRVRAYNVTQAAEIDNTYVSGGTSWSYAITTEAVANDTIKLYVCKEGYYDFVATGIYSTSAGITFAVDQVVHPVIETWVAQLGYAGNTVTEYTLDVTGTVEIDANDVDGASQKRRLALWLNYVMESADGIRYLFGAVDFLSESQIRINTDVLDLKIENTNATTALYFTDLTVRLYRDDGTSIIASSSYSIHNDYSGVPDVVETGVSGLTGPESAALLAIPTNTVLATDARLDYLDAAISDIPTAVWDKTLP